MNIKLPLSTEIFLELEQTVLKNLLVKEEINIDALYSDRRFLNSEPYIQTIDIAHHLIRSFNSSIKRITKEINSDIEFEEEYIDIIYHMFESIYLYDFELNKQDSSRSFIFSMVERYPVFYFKMLLKTKHLEEMYNYLTLLNHYKTSEISEGIADLVHLSKGRENKGIEDIGYLLASMDLATEDLRNPVPFSFTNNDANTINLSFVFTLNNKFETDD